MSDKSFVALEMNICPICGHTFDTGTLLIDRRLKDSMPTPGFVTGYSLCEKCDGLFKDGYIALVAADASRSKIDNNILRLQDAYRTGEIVHIRRSVFSKIFDCSVSESLPMCFVDPEVITRLKKMMPEEHRDESEEGKE